MEMEHSEVIFYVVLIVLAGIIRWIANGLDRERIREHVERSGGKVIAIEWSPFGKGWFGSHERIYEVRYTTRSGKLVEAACKTSMFSGVYWTSDHPPESFGPAVSDESLGRETSEAPAEAVLCLSCGATIPARDNRCPKCGWSFQSQ
jgi:hypothetical protein